MLKKRRRMASAAVTVLAPGTVALLFAACGGATGPGVASLGSSSTTTSPAAASSNTNKTTDYLDGVKYAQCMRSHGVPSFPDPNSQGNFLYHADEINGQRVDVDSSQYKSANKACTHLLPNGGQLTPAEQQALLAQALKFVQCLRTHGIPNEPDPSTSGGGVSLRLPGRPNSPLVQKAIAACKSFAPGGGP